MLGLDLLDAREVTEEHDVARVDIRAQRAVAVAGVEQQGHGVADRTSAVLGQIAPHGDAVAKRAGVGQASATPGSARSSPKRPLARRR